MFKYIIIADDNPSKRHRMAHVVDAVLPDKVGVRMFARGCDFLNFVCSSRRSDIQEHPEEYLLLIDLQLPVYGNMIQEDGGYQILAELTKRGAKSSAILISAEAICEERARAEYPGFVGSIRYYADTSYLADELSGLLGLPEPVGEEE